jgi:hypothetical protein
VPDHGLQFDKRSQLFIRMHNETLAVAVRLEKRWITKNCERNAARGLQTSQASLQPWRGWMISNNGQTNYGWTQRIPPRSHPMIDYRPAIA